MQPEAFAVLALAVSSRVQCYFRVYCRYGAYGDTLMGLSSIYLMMILAVQVNPFPQPIPAPAPAPNINVTVVPPEPDPVQTQATYDFVTANAEYNHVSIPVGWANGLLAGANIWTRTPSDMLHAPEPARLRGIARTVGLGLFLIGIVWTGLMMAFGTSGGMTAHQQLLPLLIAGFLIAMYAQSISQRSIDLCNWINASFGSPSLTEFSAGPLTLPDRPVPPTGLGQAASLVAGFFSGLVTSLIFAVILILLEVKMIYREAILLVTSTVMPIAGVLWAFKITRGWGVVLFRLFFGWTFGQPLVVVCLLLAGSLLTLMNLTDGPAEVLVKVAILLLALKVVSLFAGGGLGSGAVFGLAAVMMLARRGMRGVRGGGSSTPSASPVPSAAVQQGIAGGTGDGSAATGRPWRPAAGTI